MWFGTEAGLAKFDGRRTQAITDADLPTGRVLALQSDQDGSLWIGTAAGAALPRRDLSSAGVALLRRGLAAHAPAEQREEIGHARLLPLLLDVSGRATYTDFIGVVSGRSDRQVDAIAENVRDVMERRGWRLLGREGSGNGRWTLLDFGDVVLHVFYHPVREIYDIEGLWIDAPRIQLAVPPEAQLYQPDALYGTL